VNLTATYGEEGFDATKSVGRVGMLLQRTRYVSIRMKERDIVHA
jgi:hypothetical protein